MSEPNEGASAVVQIEELLRRSDQGQHQEAGEREDRHSQQRPRHAQPGALPLHVRECATGVYLMPHVAPALLSKG